MERGIKLLNILRIFVNVTLYPQYNNNKTINFFKKEKKKENHCSTE
jgi:hypothetical protein